MRRKAKLITETTVNGTPNGLSRRQFLKVAGAGSAGVVAVSLLSCTSPLDVSPTPSPTTAAPPKRTVFVPNATMMILGDPTKCVGCRRCEIACTNFNEGRVQPSLARVKVNRNYNFGPQGSQAGFFATAGIYGNGRIVQDTCKQCPHPVPCLDACPAGAIEIAPGTNARVVNVAKCTGCKTCQRACPWAMTTFDAVAKKASKCHLCNGDPECVKACPTGALLYVPWTDKTMEIPARYIPSAVDIAPDVKATCADCHPAVAASVAK
jgi:Fe-S-cluster-containing dehydrogenase component